MIDIEPTEIVAGETVEWERDGLSDYPASEWTLTYFFFNSERHFSVAAEADGDNYDITITAVVSAAYTAGDYKWRAFVSKGEGESLERYEVDSGYITIKPNPTALEEGAALDYRSSTKKALEAVLAVIELRASKDQMGYTIAGRRLDRTPIPDLIILWNKLNREYQKELKDEKIAKGEATGSKILIRFK